MCGIFGCIIREGQAVKLINDGLKRLEYRGYDSTGVAVINNNKMEIRKDKGRIEEVVNALHILDMQGKIGLGHTRWATHGAPAMENAHPHTDENESIALIHNGVIENYLELKDELLEKGHIFKSRTDTEVIPHLIEEEMKNDIGLQGAMLRVLRRLKGSYAIVLLSTHEPEKIYCARNESPLVLGVSDNGTYCASDVPALLPYTNQVNYLRNGEMAILNVDGYKIIKISDGSEIERPNTTITWSPEMAEKQGYKHYMLKEIYEQPTSLRDGLRLQERYLDLLTQFLDRGKEVFLVAAGTSFHSCLAGSYLFSKLARLTTFPVVSSEFMERYGSTVGIDSIVLTVSQSGETYDTLKAIDHARMRASTVLGITNTVGSTLTRVARAYIIQQSGPEIGVAATKTFTSQVLVLAQMALLLAKNRGKLSQDELDDLDAKLHMVPDWVEETLAKNEERIKELARSNLNEELYVFLGRGISSATALEGRLKLLEITYVPSLAYPAGESKHGPISIIEEGVTCVFVCPRGESHTHIIGSIMEMKSRGAKIISICEEGDEDIKRVSDEVVEMPRGIPDELSPIVYITPLQLFAYHLAVMKGLDPDKPRNLAKSVTVP
ncbi:glutamine--fructose-6-phosphate transaminase (isomerizing) [Candidatus Bathyarchaeota archaeon]|jgi:glucosamine--fructose-6-phosphate aminotransferase (isomerizing)|nr:MAG: glutamine--fructose-6-phosphate transaminase (isomerizing) [Candidatus Bathyarchaeota archaeon]